MLYVCVECERNNALIAFRQWIRIQLRHRRIRNNWLVRRSIQLLSQVAFPHNITNCMSVVNCLSWHEYRARGKPLQYWVHIFFCYSAYLVLNEIYCEKEKQDKKIESIESLLCAIIWKYRWWKVKFIFAILCMGSFNRIAGERNARSNERRNANGFPLSDKCMNRGKRVCGFVRREKM